MVDGYKQVSRFGRCQASVGPLPSTSPTASACDPCSLVWETGFEGLEALETEVASKTGGGHDWRISGTITVNNVMLKLAGF